MKKSLIDEIRSTVLQSKSTSSPEKKWDGTTGGGSSSLNQAVYERTGPLHIELDRLMNATMACGEPEARLVLERELRDRYAEWSALGGEADNHSNPSWIRAAMAGSYLNAMGKDPFKEDMLSLEHARAHWQIANSHGNIALTHIDRGEGEDAVDHAVHAVQNAPEHGDHWVTLGLALHLQDEKEALDELFRTVPKALTTRDQLALFGINMRAYSQYREMADSSPALQGLFELTNFVEE